MPDRHINVGDARIHVVETGDPDGRPIVLLHGWPESSATWAGLTAVAGDHIHMIAVDLPGVGDSTNTGLDGSKVSIAAVIHQLIGTLGLTGVTLVGHDIGGMVVYAYLRAYQDIERAVIMNVPIPGVSPWEDFIRSPFLFHFALHSIKELPEILVRGRVRPYFDYFYDLLAADPGAIDESARAAYVAAYENDGALSAGFDWYRAFAQDAEDNLRAGAGPQVTTPLLYLRGGEERGGDISQYVGGLREAGLQDVVSAVIPGTGHFPQHEAPEETWRVIAGFAGL